MMECMTEPEPEMPEMPKVFQISLPEENIEGRFADFANLWHTPNVFVLDFVALTQPPQVGETEDGDHAEVIPGRVVSRIRIPPEQVFELAAALTRQLGVWESETGRKPPAKPLYDSQGRQIHIDDEGVEGPE
ncbi:hypothetical protein SA2016_2893 [Sinomonas atrocyanea]|uniref:DUF3467 domain-containing protein n=2 Tax=Sinomonas atrocyanea TaxID=37927 RepID=A0A127A268_9MICC|nr:hypothetical protein SA2016_2893 [Sinomonas atrocyanea]